MPQKVLIAVRMPDKSRRLYRVDDVGMSVEEMARATLHELPLAHPVLIGLPSAPRALFDSEPEVA